MNLSKSLISLVLRRHIAIPYSPYNRLIVPQLASVHLNTTVIPLSTRILARVMTTPISLQYKDLFRRVPSLS